MFLRHVLLIALTAAVAQSQVVRIGNTVPPDLRSYLALTDTQVLAINLANGRLSSLEFSKDQRRAEVMAEITQEKAKETIDPAALGVRYREIVLIDREIAAERSRVRTETVALLTPAQRTKLDALAEVLRLQSTACAAVDSNLLPSITGFLTITPVTVSPAPFPGSIIPALRNGAGPGGCNSSPNFVYGGLLGPLTP